MDQTRRQPDYMWVLLCDMYLLKGHEEVGNSSFAAPPILWREPREPKCC